MVMRHDFGCRNEIQCLYLSVGGNDKMRLHCLPLCRRFAELFALLLPSSTTKQEQCSYVYAVTRLLSPPQKHVKVYSPPSHMSSTQAAVLLIVGKGAIPI